MWITIIVALILVLAVGGGLGYFLVLPAIQQSSPDSTLRTYCDASKKMDGHELYGTLSSSLKAQPRNGEANFQFGFGMLKAMGTSFTDCTVSNVQQHGSTATATITITSVQDPSKATVKITSGQSQSYSTTQTVSLIVENGVWKVNTIES